MLDVFGGSALLVSCGRSPEGGRHSPRLVLVNGEVRVLLLLPFCAATTLGFFSLEFFLRPLEDSLGVNSTVEGGSIVDGLVSDESFAFKGAFLLVVGRLLLLEEPQLLFDGVLVDVHVLERGVQEMRRVFWVLLR